MILFLLEEIKEGFLGEVSLELHFVKSVGFRYAERGIFQVEETAEAAVGGGIMEKRVLLVFDRVEGLCRAHPLCRPGVQVPERRNDLLKAIQEIPCRTPDIYAPIAYHRDARLGSASSLGFSNPGTRTSTPFFSSSRRLHAEFAAERDWGQFHQPRNLLLALVGEVGELAELL